MPLIPLLLIAAGAGGMYLLDPQAGARRREQLRQQLMKLQAQTRTMVEANQQTIQQSDRYTTPTHYSNDPTSEAISNLEDRPTL
jgi:hypothetical protein